MKSNKKKFWLVIPGVLVLLVAAGLIYFAIYYHPDSVALSYEKSTGDVTVSEDKDGVYFDGEGTEDLFIFYPGAKVDYRAYSPIAYKLAEQGVDAYIIDVPLNFAFLGINKAEDVIKTYKYDGYYIGGHSLGGVAGSTFVEANPSKIAGMVFLASYPTKDLPDNILTLSVYGSNDLVIRSENYRQSKSLWSDDAKELVIEGGNHGGFGSYGHQKGDGKLEIKAEDQWDQTAEFIAENILNSK